MTHDKYKAGGTPSVSPYSGETPPLKGGHKP